MSNPAPDDRERGYENLWVLLPEVLLNDPDEPTLPVPAVLGYEHCCVVLPEVDLDTGEVVPLADGEKTKNTDPPFEQDKKSA